MTDNTFNQDNFADKIKNVATTILAERRAEAEQQEQQRRQKEEWQESRFQHLLKELDECTPTRIEYALRQKKPTCSIGTMPESYVDSSFDAPFNELALEMRNKYLAPRGKRLFAILEKAGLSVYPIFNGTDSSDYSDEDSDEASDPTCFDIVVDLTTSPSLRELFQEASPSATETVVPPSPKIDQDSWHDSMDDWSGASVSTTGTDGPWRGRTI